MNGEQLGPYQIERELGSGGMGKVYAATVAERAPGYEIGERVALKVVHQHLLETPGFFKRFVREAELGASVRHQNVVRTFECNQQIVDGLPRSYLVMEYVEGQTLATLRDELERVPEELCFHVAREICRGLIAIHAAGIVHRDVKPENVLITADHEIKLMDLGVALLMDEALRLSRSGAFVGSVEYAAPEQFQGGDVDGRTDLYALGILLYEISTGTHPHRGDGFHAVLQRVLNDAPRPLGDVNPQLSAFFEEIVHTLLVKEPRGRFASAAQLLEVLEEGEDSQWWHERARARQAEDNRPLRRVRVPRDTAVYGRESELEQLRGLYANARAGHGQVVLIEGEAGIGKSRLVDELVSVLQADGEDFNFLFGSYPPNGAATASGAFSSAYREHFGESGSEGYLQRTPSLVAAFDALLGGQSAPANAESLTKESLQTCFVNATRALAEERVTVVLIDDLHFAPDEGRALFTSIAMAVPADRVLFIGTTRPVITESWQQDLDRFDFTTRIAPQRLAAKDVMQLLADSFQSKTLAESLGLQIIVKSDGNPFFAFEIIRGLREGQFIKQQADGTWIGTQVIEEIEIPSTVLDLVNARVADLDEDQRDLLEVACCWGFEFDPAVIGAVVGMARIPLLKSFAHIERTHRIVRASGRQYVFDHHQVQEALYGELHIQLREEYHAALAEAVESIHDVADREPSSIDGSLAVDLCEHFLRGRRGERALRYFDAAQAHLAEGYLHAQVAALFERALDMRRLLQGRPRMEKLLALCAAQGPLDRLGRRERQEASALEALGLADELDDRVAQVAALRALAWGYNRTSRHAEAETQLRRALDLAVADGNRGGEAGIRTTLGLALWALGRRDEMRDEWERALRIYREAGDRAGESTLIGNLGGLLHGEGRLREARKEHERHLALCRELGDVASEAGALINLGLVDYEERRFADARDRWHQGLAIFNEIGERRSAAVAIGNLGNVFLVENRFAEAREQYERCLALSCEIGNREGEVRATGNLGSVSWYLGRLDDAKRGYERYAELSAEIGLRSGVATAEHNLGAVLRDQGELAAAEERLRASLVICEETDDRQLAAITRLGLGSLLAEQKRSDAGAFLRVALAQAIEHGFPDVEVLARCELACLEDGDAAAALAAWEQYSERLAPNDSRSACFLLWKATGDPAHLDHARRLLLESVASVSNDDRKAILGNLRINSEIIAAWEVHSASLADGSEGESPTRFG